MSKLIYKFLPNIRLSYLEDELLRLTQPSDLNDPFELLPVLPSKEEFLSVLKRRFEENMEFLKLNNVINIDKDKFITEQKTKYNELVKAINLDNENSIRNTFLLRLEELNKHMGIISLTRRWDSTLMWSHYSNSHTGFCVGFDSENPFFKDYRKIADIQKIFWSVIYSNQRIKVPTEKGEKIDMKVLLTKSKEWEYEEEERLIVFLRLAKKIIKSEPYDIYLYKIPHTLIKEIIVGVNCPKNEQKIIENFCKKNNIELYKCKISDEHFNMERIRYSL